MHGNEKEGIEGEIVDVIFGCCFVCVPWNEKSLNVLMELNDFSDEIKRNSYSRRKIPLNSIREYFDTNRDRSAETTSFEYQFLFLFLDKTKPKKDRCEQKDAELFV